MKGKKATFILILLHLGLCAGCNSSGDKKKSTEPDDKVDQYSERYFSEGKILSQSYCVSCHLYSSPSLLPRHIWEKEVLPKMASFYGIYEKGSRAELLETGEAKKKILAANIYPENPIIDSLHWKKIKDYILYNAPHNLTEIGSEEMQMKEVFEKVFPEQNIRPPMTTMVQFQEKSKLIYHGDVKRDYSLISIFTTTGEMVQSLAMRSPAVKIKERDGQLWALLMGSFTSTDAPMGSIVKISKKDGAMKYNDIETVIEGLQRPVDLAYADFDNDGDEDIVVSQFGNWTGKLEWFENVGEDGYERHLLIEKTGPTRVIAEDLNDDGLSDILVMVTQADESVYALINRGRGNFIQKKLLQLPPTHGSVTFEYKDMDGDGLKDILHVAGDNADYEPVLKPYHGVRIFKGSENLVFKETYFYHVNGAYDAIPEDFDGDGDADIAVISFFPDYENGAKESLMMLENKSTTDSLLFKGFTLSGFEKGRWDVMDSGDFDNDGATDLIVGSFVVKDPYGEQQGVQTNEMMNGPMFMILKNKWQKHE